MTEQAMRRDDITMLKSISEKEKEVEATIDTAHQRAEARVKEARQRATEIVEDARNHALEKKRIMKEKTLEAVREEAKAIALGGPQAVAEAKRLIRIVSRVPMDEAFAYAEKKIAELFASAEAAEGMASFVTKRQPEWAE